MPSCISHKLKKKAVVKPLQIILLINIRYALESRECACVYFAVLLGNGPGIRFCACLPGWAHVLSWTDASLSGPEVKYTHQHSAMSNLMWFASALVWLRSSGPKADLHIPGPKAFATRASATLPPFGSYGLSQHKQFSTDPQHVGPAIPRQVWPSLLALFRN